MEKNSSLAEWQDSTGLSRLKNIESSEVFKILEMPSSTLIVTDVRELQRYLIILARYRMFLAKELGDLKSKLDLNNRRLNHRIDLVSSRQIAHTGPERRALAIQTDDKVGEYMRKVTEYEEKYNKLRGFPDAVQEFINQISRLEYRLSNEKKVEDNIRD